jgi:cytosine deaminase
MPTAFLTNALLPDGRAAHIGIAVGPIAEIRSAERPVDESAAAMDVGGALVLPGFVHGHLHLQRATLIGWRSKFRRDEEILAAFDTVTAAGAQAHSMASGVSEAITAHLAIDVLGLLALKALQPLLHTLGSLPATP